MKTKRSKQPAKSTRPRNRSTTRRRSVDTTDIPPLADAFFKAAIRNPFYEPVKQPTTVRLDADVFEWLHSQGSGYEARINAILRRAMQEEDRTS